MTRNSTAGYPSYRESGVKWIGRVPLAWEVLASARISDLTTGGRDTQDAAETGMYPFFVRSQTIERIDTYSFDGEGVLTSGDGAGVGKIFHHHIGKLEFHQRVYLFHNFRRVTGRFFFYFLREHLHRVALAGNAKSTVDSLRRPMLRMFPICLPTVAEQTQIAKFLDYETAKIDALIDKQQQLIALLKEKRQAVISHAVTKGLNPDAPMRDSGVEWLGEVPAHWESMSLRRLTMDHRQGYYTNSGYVDDGIKLLRITDLREFGEISFDDCPRVRRNDPALPSFLLESDDFVFARTGGAGSFGLVQDLGEEVVFASYLIRFRFNHSRVIPGFLTFYLQSGSFLWAVASNIHGGVNQNIHAEDIKNAPIDLPGRAEQIDITSYLVKMCTRVRAVAEKAERQVHLLQERRTALISAAVTGKIDVRDWKAPEPATAAEAS